MGFFSRFGADIKQGVGDAAKLTGTLAKAITKPVVGLALDSAADVASGVTGKDVTFKALGHEAKPHLSVERPQQNVDLGRVAGQTVGTAMLFAPVKTASFASKLAAPAQRGLTALPVIGKTLAPAAKPIVQTGIQALADAGVGGLSSVATDLSAGEKDWDKIKKNAKTSAIFSALLPIAVGGASGLVKGASHQVGQKEGIIKGAKNILEEGAAGAGLVATPERAIQRTGNLGYQVSKKLAAGEESSNPFIRKVSETARDITKNWLDDRAPILNNYSGKLREAGASQDDIMAAANAQANARTTDPRTLRKAYDQAETFRSIAGDDVNPAELMKATDFYADKLTKLETVRDDAAGLARVQNELDDFVKNTDPALLEKVKQAHEATVKAFNMNELADDVKAGLLSQESADAMAAKYPNYSKQMILEYIDDAGAKGSSIRKDLRNVGIKSRLEDARADLEAMDATQANLLGSMIREKRRAANLEAMTMVDLDSKNGAGVFEPLWTKADEVRKQELLSTIKNYDKFGDALDVTRLSDDAISKLANEADTNIIPKQDFIDELKALRSKEKLASGADNITLFRDGVKETYKANDRQIVDYFKGQEIKDAEAWTGALKAAADWTRKTATQYNPVFTISNMIIDNQNANAYLPAGMGFTIEDQLNNFQIADKFLKTGKPGPEIKELYELGIPLSSFNKSLSKPGVSDITEIIAGKTGSTFNPLKKIAEFSEASELSSRLAVVQAAKRAGVTDPNQLRELAKNASIDFSVSGQNLRELNRVSPFLNAAVQGTRNTFKAFAKDPAGFTRKAQFSTIYPKILLDKLNSRFDSYNNLSKKEKDENFILALGETKDKDGNKVLQRIMVPKAQGSQLVSQIMDIITDDKTDKNQKAVDLAGTFMRYAPADRVFGIGGNFMSTVKGLQTNRNYLNYDIVPQSLENQPARAQVLKTTSPLVKGTTELISKLTGGTKERPGAIELSPIKTEYALRGFTGGIGSNILSALDAGYGLATKGSVPNALTDTTVGQLSASPGFSRYFRENTPQASAEERKQSKELEDADKLRKFNLKTDATEIDALIKETAPEERGNVIKQLVDKGIMTDEVVKKLKDLNKAKDSVGSINPSAPAAVQARQIDSYISSARTDADRTVRLQELQDNNLLTKNMVNYLTALKLDEKLSSAKSDEERASILKEIAPSKAVIDALLDIKNLDPYLRK